MPTTISALPNERTFDTISKSQLYFGTDDTNTGGSYKVTLQTLIEAGVILTGTGSPEGVATAAPDALYWDKSGSPGAQLFLKASGFANTGWIPLATGGGTIDTSMSDVSANAVQNQVIKEYVDGQTQVRPGDWIVVGSGFSATDATNIATAVTALNLQGYGTLWFTGVLRLDSSHSFTAPISLLGLGTDATILVTGANAAFNWSETWNPYTAGGSTTFTSVSAFAEKFVCSAQAFDEGDLIVLMSDDVIPNIYNHLTFQSPMEVHQIWDVPPEEANTYYLGDFVVDDYATNQRVIKIPVLTRPGSLNRSDLQIGNFTLRQADGIYDNLLFYVQCCNGVTIKNINYELNSDQGGPGYWIIRYCTNVDVSGCRVDGVESYDGKGGAYGYLFTVGPCNRVNFHHNFFRRAAHYVTTTSGHSTASTRWGNCRGLVVENNICSLDANPADGAIALASKTALDCHPETWGAVFQNNTFHIGGLASNIGISTRGRHTICKNNAFFGGGACKGIYTRADDCVITGNTFQGLWQCVTIHNEQADRYRNIVTDNVFDNCIGNAGRVFIVGGDYHKVCRNHFLNNAGGCILVNSGDNIDIIGNEFLGTGTTDTESVVHFAGTSVYCNVIKNTFVDNARTCVEFAASNPSNVVSGNTFINSSAGVPLVKFAGGAGIVVRMNDMQKYSNTLAVDFGTCTDLDVNVVGNAFGGGYANVLGAGGTNAPDIVTAYSGKNWT